MTTDPDNELALALKQPLPFRPLIVMNWELRRLALNRSSWVMAGTAMFCFLGILLVRHDWGLAANLMLLGTTNHGQLGELVYELMIVFGLALPFLTTDLVAHDYQQRMHELLMTTSMPTWAYVWGRYLAGIVVGLGLAVLLLVSQLGMNLVLAAGDPSLPAPNPIATLTLWSVIVIPATILVCSLCFALGTFWPRFTIVAKFAVCIAWVILAFDTDPLDLGWRAYWNPTGAGLATLLLEQLRMAVQVAIVGVTRAGWSRVALQLQQAMPDLRPWVGPYLALAVLGVLIVTLAAASFRRFQDVLGS